MEEILTPQDNVGKAPNADIPLWTKKKNQNVKLANMYEKARRLDGRVITPSRLHDLATCGQRLEFAMFADGTKKLNSASFCRLRLCPVCQWRRGLKLYGQVKDIVKVVMARKATFRFLFLTLTVRNCRVEELGLTLELLNAGFNRLMKDADIKDRVKGFIRCTEVTVNAKSGTVHPHYHCLVLVDEDYFHKNYLKKSRWIEKWTKALGTDYKPMIDVQAVKREGGMIDEVVGAFNYTAKSQDIDSLDRLPDNQSLPILIGLTHQLRRKKFVRFGGLLRDIRRELKLPSLESLTDKPEIAAESPLDIVGYTSYTFECRTGVYVLSTPPTSPK